MTSTSSVLADLLAECNAHGIRLALADAGGLAIDAPRDTLTPDLLHRLKVHKADVMHAIECLEERLECEAGQCRHQAERLAWNKCFSM